MNVVLSGLQALLLAIILAYVILAPYTKVEESFGVQAVHDFLYHGPKLGKYDHQEFPGVVPRSFIGPASLAVVAAPIAHPLRSLAIPKIFAQYITRCALGCFSWLCLCRLATSVQKVFGSTTAALFTLLSCLQFHVPFYASRTLPNVFAFGPVVLACAHWLDDTELWLVPAILAGVTIITRCDMLLLVVTVSLSLLTTRRMSLLALVAAGICSAAAALATTIAFDSLIWGRLLWPEGEVLWFNTILNKSKEWGVMPFHWYWTSALPRGLLASLPLAAVGAVLEPKARQYAAAITAFIALYSCLGHKEIRFLFPVLPMCTVVAACGLKRLWTSGSRSPMFALARLGTLAALALSAAAVVVFAQASMHNYPGGEALAWLHEHHAQLQGTIQPHPSNLVTVHMDTLACMSGVTRFGQVMPAWQYFKNETLTVAELLGGGFDFLLSAQEQVHGFEVVHVVLGFEGLSFRRTAEWTEAWWPIKVNRSPQLYIHKAVVVTVDGGVKDRDPNN